MAGLQFLEKLNKGLSSQGTVKKDSNSRRLEDVENDSFQLSNYLDFKIVRGDEDSANADDLSFMVNSAGLENNLLMF